MQYSEGRMGRIFVLRIDEGEDLVASLQRFVLEKDILSCMILFIGALRDGQAVAGPVAPVVLPVPHYEHFCNGWEIFGMATIYDSPEGPKLHIHSAIGKASEAIVGCIRQWARIYLVVEAVLYELADIKVVRNWDEKTGLHLLSLEDSL